MALWHDAHGRDSALGKGHIQRPCIGERHPNLRSTTEEKLPGHLRQLLEETNGIQGEYGLGLLWSTERIARDNTYFRTDADYRELYMPFLGLVFFADAGNGDQFAVSLSGNCEIYVWNHVDDSRTWVAPTVMRYLEEWMTGRLTV